MISRQTCLLAFALLLPFAVFSQTRGMVVRLTSPGIVELTPGKILAASFLLANHSDREEEFVEQLTLPEGWLKVAPLDAPFTLRPKEERVRVVAVSVPATSAPGRFDLNYSVKSRRDYAITDTASVTVRVLPVAKLELVLEDKPPMAIAGDDYEVRLKLINRGNSASSFKLQTESIPNYAVRMEASLIELAAGAAASVRLQVSTDAELKRKITHVVVVRARAEDGPASAVQTVTVEVIPKVTGETDPYLRLPAHLKFMAAKEDGHAAGFQVEFAGGGNLDEQGERKVDFLFRGPDLQDRSLYGLRDEYRVSYLDKWFDVHAGDRNFTLSPLTERYGYGRGAELNLHPGRFGAGAFYVQSRWRTDNFSETGTYLKQDLSKNLTLRGNFLAKEGHSSFLTNAVPANIYSVQPQVRFGKSATLDLEYAVSDSSAPGRGGEQAYRAELKGQIFDGVNYALERVRAEPRFFGYYNDSDLTSGTVTFPLYKKLRGNFSYNQYETNLERDPARSSMANRETLYRPGLLYTFASGTDLSLAYQHIRREDASAPADFDFEENSARLGLGHSFGKFSVQGFLEGGLLDDNLTGTTEDVERYGVYCFYRPNARQSYSVFANFGSARFTSNPQRSETFGASGKWNLNHKLTLDACYTKNRFETTIGRDQDIASATASYTFPNRHLVALNGRWVHDNVTKEVESSAFLSYTIPLNLPFRKKRSVGGVRGRIFSSDGGQELPVSRAILTLDDATAVSSRNGEFRFPALKPGTHLLRLEQNSIGMDRVTAAPLPLLVEVKSGNTSDLKVRVVDSCKLSFGVRIFAAAASQRPTPDLAHTTATIPIANAGAAAAGPPNVEFREISGFEATVVEITNGQETLRQVTDRLGNVTFDQLRPGKWTVKVDAGQAPPHHYFEQPELQIEIGPREEKSVVLRVLPRQRSIRIVDQGEVKS